MISDRRRVEALLESERLRLARAYIHFVRQIRQQRFQRDHGQILRRMQDPLRQFARELSIAYARARRHEYDKHRGSLSKAAPALIAKQPRVEAASEGFGDDNTADFMRRAELDFIQGFNEDQRETVRNALSDALDRGLGPKQAARSFRDSVGLTEAQADAVRSYRTLLETGSKEALNRDLRDARSDRRLTSAIDRGDVLSDGQIDLMVGRYSDNMVAHRADTIALTESHRAVSAGRQQALQDLADNYDIDENNITRTWNATQDARTRETHAEMDGQQVTGFEPFVSPSGARLQYPGDPSAPPEETIRCRCVETYDIATPDDEEA